MDGKNTAMGRLASYVAKEALKGAEIAVVNCEEIIITGNKKWISQDLELRKTRIGNNRQGPKFSFTVTNIVKRCIRGMIPHHDHGRGREAFRRIKCYPNVPQEFEGKEKISLQKENRKKFAYVKDVAR